MRSRSNASLLPLLPKKGGEGGERRPFFSSPLSSSLPARSSRGEREKCPRRFSCRTLLVADPPSALCQPPFGSHPPPNSRTKLSALRSFLRRRDHGKIIRAKGRRRQTFTIEQVYDRIVRP